MLTKHFPFEQLRCKCGCEVSQEIRAELLQLAEALEVIRAEVGTPLVVTSGYRCPTHNASDKVKGSPRSEHLTGRAADFWSRRFIDGRDLAALVERLVREGKIPEGGLGTYGDARRFPILHYDTRGARARWRK